MRTLTERLAGRTYVRSVAANTAWLIGERIVRGVIAVTVMAAVARHLGTAEFGLLNYALSFVLLFATLWQLGLSGLVVRELVRKPERHDELLGTVFVLRLTGAVGGFLLVVAISSLVALDDPTVRLAIVIIAAGTLFYSVEGIDFWLQSEMRSRYGVAARGIALLVTSGLYLYLIIVDAPLLAFATVASIEYVATGLSLVGVYRWLGRTIFGWRFSRAQAVKFLSLSWPLILSGLASAINLRIDQLMLGNLAGATAAGVYAAAARLSEVWYFVPIALATSVLPGLVHARASDLHLYERRQQRLYDTMISLSLPLAIVVSFASQPIILLIYGTDFAESAAVLAIHVWASPFVFMAAVLSKWLITENLLKFSLVRHGAGAAVNVAANLLLIPLLGPVGAAIATFVSYAIASFAVCFIYPPTREAGKRMALALLLPFRLVLRVLR